MAPGTLIELHALPGALAAGQAQQRSRAGLDQKNSGGNRTQTADMLGNTNHTLQNKINKYVLPAQIN
jgi:DNA-binding NtrC family response regulator